MRRFWLTLATFAGLAAATVPASADQVFQLTCNANPCTTSTNYGQVTLHENGDGTVKVTVDLTTASAAETFAGSGAGYTIAWNFNGSPAPTETISGIMVSPTGDNTNFVAQTNPGNFKASPFTGGSCKNAGDCFMYAIDTTINGQNSSDNKLVFDVSASSALTINSFLKGTTDGFLFAVDIFRQGATFNVAAKIPEPATWLMFFAGLVGLTLLFQRRRKFARAA